MIEGGFPIPIPYLSIGSIIRWYLKEVLVHVINDNKDETRSFRNISTYSIVLQNTRPQYFLSRDDQCLE